MKIHPARLHPKPAAPGAQQGIALVMALVILLILTILGVSALRTTSLEQLMSGNIQEMTRALETADSGASKVMVDLVTFNSIPAAGNNYQDFNTDYSATGSNDSLQASARIFRAQDTQVVSNMMMRGNRPVFGTKTAFAFRDQVVQGKTTNAAGTRAQQTLQQGVRQPSLPGGEFVN